jgi:formate dehydrogenase major subunit
MARSIYGLGVTEHSQGSTTVMAMANLAMATGNIGRDGVGVNPLRGQNNVQGACDMGSFPHEFPAIAISPMTPPAQMFETMWGVHLDAEPGLRIPNMLDEAVGHLQGRSMSRARTSPSPTPTPSTSRPGCPRWNA